jgi:peptidoglycan DL-endopeptidase CwlO
MAGVLHRAPVRSIAVAAVFLSCLAATASPAAADTLLQQKQAQYARIKAQVHRLDLRTEQLAEQYDKVRWHLQVLKHKIRAETVRLLAEEAVLHRQQSNLAELLVAQYKSGNPRTIEIILGATSFSQVTNGLAVTQQVDTAVSDTVDAIRAARNAIAHARELLVLDRRASRAAERRLAAARRAIAHELHRRRALEAEIGNQVTVLTAADRIGQGPLALAAHTWLEADLKADAGDPGQALRDQVALDSLAQIGVPYVWGGASPTGGFDCSGLVTYLWAQHGVALPHFAAAQFHLGPVWLSSQSELRPGDLVFFHDLGHVAIYIGNGYVVHAPHTGTYVQISQLSIGWFQATYVGATQPGPA